MNTVLSALYTRVIRPVKARLRLEEGLEAVEYALIAALLAVVIVGAMAIFTPALQGVFQNISNVLNDSADNIPGGGGGGEG